VEHEHVARPAPAAPRELVDYIREHECAATAARGVSAAQRGDAEAPRPPARPPGAETHLIEVRSAASTYFHM
jgi:hypothetical protein